MPLEQRVKNLAYTIDAEAWKSHLVRTKSEKQLIEYRRAASVEAAQKIFNSRHIQEDNNVVKKSNERLAAQLITNAIGRVIRANLAAAQVVGLRAADQTFEPNPKIIELDGAERNLMGLLTELQERK